MTIEEFQRTMLEQVMVQINGLFDEALSLREQFLQEAKPIREGYEFYEPYTRYRSGVITLGWSVVKFIKKRDGKWFASPKYLSKGRNTLRYSNKSFSKAKNAEYQLIVDYEDGFAEIRRKYKKLMAVKRSLTELTKK